VNNATGTLLSGRYELREVIGSGGMGVVHRGWDNRLQRPVAVKILHDRATDPVCRARFRAEGTTLGGLSHPGLITLYDAATDDDEPYLVMELIEGRALNSMAHGRALDPGLVVTMGAALAEALDHVHRHRVVHRDIKPANVLVDRDGRVKLADFGVACLLDNLTRQTATGTTVGTAAYLSPEQVRGESATTSTDVYSLGLVLIEVLSGEPAFVGEHEVVALARLTRPPRIADGIAPRLRELLVEMTGPDPVRRPSAAAVGAELRSLSTDPEALIPVDRATPAGAARLGGSAPDGNPAADRPGPFEEQSTETSLGASTRETNPRRRVLRVALAVGAAAALVLTGFLAQRIISPTENSAGRNGTVQGRSVPGEGRVGAPATTSATGLDRPGTTPLAPNRPAGRVGAAGGDETGRAPGAGAEAGEGAQAGEGAEAGDGTAPTTGASSTASPVPAPDSSSSTTAPAGSGTPTATTQSKAEAKAAKMQAHADAKEAREAAKAERKSNP
jgi:eukaryotic-like serine/threonine-protein kinase